MRKSTLTKSILAVIFGCIMMFRILPMTVTAMEKSQGANYDLWIGGVQVTDENQDDITEAINAVTPNSASGTANFDPSTNTLTISDFQYEGAGYVFKHMGTDSAAAIYSELETLRVVVMNENKISHNETNYESYGIYTAAALMITEQSTGSLLVSGATTNTRSIGIFVADKDITVNGGVVHAEGGHASKDDLSSGVWCFNGNVIVNEKGTLIGSGGNANITRGVCVSGKLVINGGKVTGNGGNGQMISHGISTGSLESNSEEGQLIGVASNADESIGILIWDESAFAKGTMQGYGGEGQSNQSYGISLQDILTINNGTVISKGANSAFDKAPVISSEFTNAGIWYGETEDKANANGAKPAEEIATQYVQKYVCVAVNNINVGSSTEEPDIFVPESPKTGDSSNLWLWVAILFVSGFSATTTIYGKKKI